MKNSPKKKIIEYAKSFLWLLFLLALLAGLVWMKAKLCHFNSGSGSGAKIEQKAGDERFSGFVGESIVYDVKFGAVTLGRATFRHISRTELGSRQVNFMTFQTSLARFNDLEKIYSDLYTFLPLRVERDVSTWPNRENITEDYDQKEFSLNITKVKGNKIEKLSIKKDGPIYNAILLPFHVRMIPGLGKDFSMKVRLPTQDFTIRLAAIEDVTVPAGTFKAYKFESEPRKFEIWISADECRTPLRIKGSGFLGYTLLMREHRLP